MTLKNKRPSLISNIKLYASFNHHMWFKTGVSVRLSWVMTAVTLTFDLWPWSFAWTSLLSLVIGIDHDTVCAGVVGTAIRNSTSCAGRRAAACDRAGRHNECCSGLQYQTLQRRPYKWSISILPWSQFTKRRETCVFDVLYRCSSPSAFA